MDSMETDTKIDTKQTQPQSQTQASSSTATTTGSTSTTETRKKPSEEELAKDKGGLVQDQWWIPRGFDMAKSGWTTLENVEDDSYRGEKCRSSKTKTKGLDREESPER